MIEEYENMMERIPKLMEKIRTEMSKEVNELVEAIRDVIDDEEHFYAILTDVTEGIWEKDLHVERELTSQGLERWLWRILENSKARSNGLKQGWNSGYRKGWQDAIQKVLEIVEPVERTERADERMQTITVPVSEAEAIKKLKQEKGVVEAETLINLPKLYSVSNSKEMCIALLFSVEDKKPLTQKMLRIMLNVTQARISQITNEYQDRLIKIVKVDNPDPYDYAHKHVKGYTMPGEVKEKIAKTVVSPDVVFDQVKGIAERYPHLPWRFDVDGEKGD